MVAVVIAVSAVPFAIGLLLGVGAFGGLTYYLIQESQRPIEWSVVEARARTSAFDSPHVSHTRLATVCVLFTLWSLWATARPVSGWR
jgi:hypothetical protein